MRALQVLGIRYVIEEKDVGKDAKDAVVCTCRLREP